MDFKRFFFKIITYSGLIIGIWIAITIYIDEFGLYRNVKGRKISIEYSERPIKYLLSQRYVPTNFNAILIGPSLSVQLDTSKMTSLKIYNLSLFGANAFEMQILAENAIKSGKMRAVIICLDPYIFRDSSVKDPRMGPSINQSVLGSTFMLDLYTNRISRRFGKNSISFNYNDHGSAGIFPYVNSRPAILVFAKMLRDMPSIPMDPKAVEALRSIVKLAHDHGAKVFAFFYPMPTEVYQAVLTKNYAEYKQTVLNLFDKNDYIWDCNSSEFSSFTCDYRNYDDHEHISPEGAEYLVHEIDKTISEHLP